MKSAPASVIWASVATARGLQQWFADEVTAEGRHYVFSWKGSVQEADITAARTESYVRFKWVDTGTWFEMRINVNELTGHSVLRITDNVEDDDVDSSTQLWRRQIDRLKIVLGVR
ncbi:MAG: hypothetical protein K2L49_00940 [Muribaculaceae bacterium]|nr:hypothetical protein [Muribaculaceae bacterium]